MMPSKKRQRATTTTPSSSSTNNRMQKKPPDHPRTNTGANTNNNNNDNTNNNKNKNRDWKQWKQQQHFDYNTHQFLDASATVQAGLFAARRLPEIKSLWRQLVQKDFDLLTNNNNNNNESGGSSIHGRGGAGTAVAVVAVGKRNISAEEQWARRAGQSGGGKISSRHLRRRTGSHKRKRRHRFPRGEDLDLKNGREGDGTTTIMHDCGYHDDDDAKDDVKGMAVAEGEDTSESKGGSAESGGMIETNMDQQQEQHQKQPINQHKKPCRRTRRKPALLKVSHSHWWHTQQNVTLESQDVRQTHPKHSITSLEQQPKPQQQQQQQQQQQPHLHHHHHWIPTHQWHAKRFHISPKLFSWSIPLVHSNRGSRASLRLASSSPSSISSNTLSSSSSSLSKCTIQDASWEVDGRAVVLNVSALKSSQTTAMDSLSVMLQRICGNDAPFLTQDSVLEGGRMGEGLIYDVDSYPMMPVGPAMFLFGCWNGIRDDDANSSSSSSSMDEALNKAKSLTEARVCIFVHPSIRPTLVSLLTTILAEGTTGNETDFTISTMPLSILRVRGRSSTSSVAEVLSCNLDEMLNEDAEDNASFDKVVDHGTLLELDGNQCPSFTATKMDSTTCNTLPSNGTSEETKVSSTASKFTILLKSHQPNQRYTRNHQLQHNIACSGWDILCHPSLASKIFQSFVTKGRACAIGLAEDSRAQLEAYPPLPIFPRDFPDTKEGRIYWEGSTCFSNDGSEEGKVEEEGNNKWSDWVVIRACIEGSWGRMHTQLKKVVRRRKELEEQSRNGKCSKRLMKQVGQSVEEEDTTEDQKIEISDAERVISPQDEFIRSKLVTTGDELLGNRAKLIHWMSLVSSSENTFHQSSSSNGDHPSVIVVRGTFGIPFLQLLHSCGHISISTTSSTDINKKSSHRRPRRKSRPPSSAIQASPLSQKDMASHSILCQQLKSSLSLPALLRCEIYCEGKGTLTPGDLFFPLSLPLNNDSEIEDPNSENKCDTICHNLLPLGIVTAGGFSPSRGKCHGTGFIGAGRFIDAVDGTLHGMGITTPQNNGQRQMALRVMLTNGSSTCTCLALVSILL